MNLQFNYNILGKNIFKEIGFLKQANFLKQIFRGNRNSTTWNILGKNILKIFFVYVNQEPDSK